MGRFVFKLPDVGEGTAEAELVAWHVKVGDTVREDQPLADVMTDKATVELTSPVDGIVRELHGEPGEMRAVKSELVILETQGAGDAEGGEDQRLVPSPSGERNVDPRDTPPTTPLSERPSAEAAGEGDSCPAPNADGMIECEADVVPAGTQGDFVFRLPDVGEGTAEAELVAWKVAVGDRVEEDQPLADVMTDKATVELTAPVAGVVTALHGEVGQMMPVKGPLVELHTGRGGPAAAPKLPTAQAPAPARVPAPSAPPVKAPEPASGEANIRAPGGGGFAASQAVGQPAFTTRAAGARPLASPAVRARAHELGVQLQFVPGAGPAGRISHADLDAYLARDHAPAPQAAGAPSTFAKREGVDELKIIGLRRRIAQQMQESKRRIPHFMYAEEVDVTELEELRAHLNATKRKDQPKLTLLPFLVVALCKVLPGYPNINARFDDDAGVLHRSRPVHLGVATQTPNGLIVPVIRHAESMDVWALASEIARLAQATRDGTAKKEELSGSTLTLTSLGPLGGVTHTPVINHPETAIVGPNKIIERPVVRHGQIVVRKMMNISSSFDHRVVDGYDAAEMIQKLKGLLEHPATLFML